MRGWHNTTYHPHPEARNWNRHSRTATWRNKMKYSESSDVMTKFWQSDWRSLLLFSLVIFSGCERRKKTNLIDPQSTHLSELIRSILFICCEFWFWQKCWITKAMPLLISLPERRWTGFRPVIEMGWSDNIRLDVTVKHCSLIFSNILSLKRNAR